MEQNKGKFFIPYVVTEIGGNVRFSNMVAIIEYRSFEDLLRKCENLIYKKEHMEHFRTKEITVLDVKEVECYVLEPNYTEIKKEVATGIVSMIDEMRTNYKEDNEKAKTDSILSKFRSIDICCNAACSTLSVLKGKIHSQYLYEDREEDKAK